MGRIKLKKLLFIFLITVCFSQNEYDDFNGWNNYLQNQVASYTQQIKSISLDSLQTDPDSLQYIIVFGTNNFDSCFVDTTRGTNSYVNMDKFALADTASYNTVNYECAIDSSDVIYYIRAYLKSGSNNAEAETANVNIDLTP